MSIILFVNIFSWSIGCLFILLIASFAVKNLWSLIRSNLFICFNFYYSRRWIQKHIALIYVQECSVYISSNNFIVSVLISRSVNNFEFISIYGVREWSNFIVLHVAVYFSQHHLSKRPSFLPCIFLPILP